MRATYLTTSLAALLLAGTSFASAQMNNEKKPDQSAPNAQMKSQPSAPSGSSSGQTTGQGSPTEKNAPNAAKPSAQSGSSKDQSKDRTTGQGSATERNAPSTAQPNRNLDRQNMNQDRAGNTGQGANQPDRRQPNEMGRSPQAQPNSSSTQGPASGSSTRGQAQTGQPNGGSVALTTEQKTTIRQTVLGGRNVPRASNVNFSISVGTRVPSTVHLVAVPEPLVRIHPAWRGNLYFVVGDEIIVVDRRTHEIIAVILV